MPFITETLWKALTNGDSLVISKWPIADALVDEKNVTTMVSDLQNLITEIRRFRNDQGIKTSAKIPAQIHGLSKGGLSNYEGALRFVTRLDVPNEKFSASAKIEIGRFSVEFDLTGNVDVVAERSRLTKDLAAIEKDKQSALVKLENENFMAKAPMDVIKEIRERAEFCTTEITRINALLAALPSK
jgi:valyl-tRNA synthetase